MSYLNWNKKQAEINLQPGSGASPGSIKKTFPKEYLVPFQTSGILQLIFH